MTRANTEAGPFSASCEKGKGYNFVLTTILVHIPVSQSRGSVDVATASVTRDATRMYGATHLVAL